MATTKDYCDHLRRIGKQLAEGEISSYELCWDGLFESLDPDDYDKITKSISYTRTIINRVPEVKVVGRVLVQIDKRDDGKYYVFTMKKGASKKVLVEDDLPHVRQIAVNKALRRLIACPPRISDLSEDEMRGAAIVIERYVEVMQDMIKGDE